MACFVTGGVLAFLSLGAVPVGLNIMDVSAIRPGMRGYGLSVFRGTKPERFDVEVIDVLSNFRPDQDLILIKTPHPLLDHAGSVAGMSGSPVYLDGRLIGAYAYGWSFGKDPIAGVTPIANMLHELNRPLRARAAGEPGLLLLRPLPAPRTHRAARPLPRTSPTESTFFADKVERAGLGFEPAATPLLVGGMSRGVAEFLREELAPFGMKVLEAAGAGKRGTQNDDPDGYVDGGSVAVSLLRGDIQATAIGTVTLVQGKRVLAFGHPMLDGGEGRLPTATARVLHVLASERSSFKIAEAGRPLGALVHDRQSAIVVDTHEAADTIPLHIRLRGVPGLARDTWDMDVASHRALTPALVLSALSSAVSAVVNDNSDMTYRAESVVTLRKFGPQRTVEEGFAAHGVSQPSALGALRTFSVLDLAFNNPFEPATIERIDVTLDLQFGQNLVELVSAQLAESEIDPGKPARIVLSLRQYGAPVEQRVLEVPLPRGAAGEQVTIELLPAHHVHIEQPVAQSLADLLQIARTTLPATSLAIQVQRRGRGISLASHVVHHLPSSALDLFDTSRDTARTPIFTTEERLLIPMGRVVHGQAKLSLDIRKEKE